MKSPQVQAIWQPWLDTDYQPLQESFKQAISAHLQNYLEQNPDTDIYGLSIYTCNGFPHFSIVLNSKSHLKSIDQKELPYYRYCPDEWPIWEEYGCEDNAIDLIEALHAKFEQIQDEYESLDPHPYIDEKETEEDDYWQLSVERIFNTALAALSELKQDGAFNWFATNPVIMIWYSDPSDWELGMCYRSVKTLCDNKTFDELVHAIDPNQQFFQEDLESLIQLLKREKLG